MKTDFAVETAKLVGTPNELCWSQTHSFFSEDSLKKEKRGDLLAILVIQGLGEGVEAMAIGREVLSRVHEEYYGNLEGSAFSRLGDTVRKVCLEQEGVEITAVSLVDNVLNVAIFGKGTVFLKRGDQFGRILTGEKDLQTASGLIKDNDFLFLGSERFFQVISEGVVKASLESGGLNEAVEFLAPLVLGRSDMAEAVAILAFFKKKEAEIPLDSIVLAEPSVAEIESRKEELPAEPLSPKPNFLAKILRKKRIFVHRRDFNRQKKLYFILSLILLAVLGLTFVFGFKKNSQSTKTTEAKELLMQAETKLNQGRALLDSSPTEARSLVQEAASLTQKALALKADYKEAEVIKGQAESFLAESVQEVGLDTANLFMDLSLVEDGANGSALALQDKNLAILDTAKKEVYLLDFEKKSNQIFTFQTEEVSRLVFLGDKIVLFSPKGIEEISLKTKSSSIKISKDNDWQQIIGLSSFGQNLYLLDTKANNLWRYTLTDGEYSAKKSWFIGSPPDLSGAVSMAIDKMVWILAKGTIWKFNLGVKENFSITKMPVSSSGETEKFANPVKIYTLEEEANLYILDKGRGKIYQIAKNGEFKVAYSWAGLKDTTDFVAIESIKKIFLLSGSKIYEIGMK